MREGKFADRALEAVAESLSETDRRLAQELAFGVLRLRGRLDYVLAPLVRGGLERLEPDVLDALRLGAYQLLELDRIPDYAAVSDSVEAATASAGRGAGGLVNAVLRRLAREGKPRAFPRPKDDPLGYLEAWGSHPRWLLARWLDRWPFEQVRRLVDYNNTRPSVYLSTTVPKDEAAERLRGAGISAEPVGVVPGSIRIDSAEIARGLAIVPAVVQDPGAAAVVEYMALSPDIPVADLCAGPGGKASLLAVRGHPVLALEISGPKVERILEHRNRLDLERLQVARADSTRPPLSRFPAVLLDAPCSGTGTLARHPDGRWRLTPRDLEALTVLQRRLLEAAARIVAPGGWLVYATCSLESEENEEQVNAFLKRHADFQLDPPARTRLAAELVGRGGELSVLPQRDGIDGAYAARLRRRSG